MKNMDWKILTDITFKTHSYRKNFDLVNKNENFITECDGVISKIRIAERKPPIVVGEYGFSVWNIGMNKIFKIDFNKLIRQHKIENTYSELKKVIDADLIDINSCNKLILIHSLVLRPDFRKLEITEEFIEMIYRDYYDENNMIIALVKPFQDNPVDVDYYMKRKSVPLRRNLGDFDNVTNIPAMKYYGLTEFIDKKDTEFNEYKLFSVASKCGFSRIGESHLFQYSPEVTINRMIEKHKMIILDEIV